jgi:hypothetical protein
VKNSSYRDVDPNAYTARDAVNSYAKGLPLVER